ncbi:unnamed protein product [Caenorhabditis angaria]|uniref:Uncharacterized protein n=1 Tax=Caenorhabditis angaria TaxID=860376 RepID=A0A9P1J4X5_9PELO|nr:unnamed protein product [Caenorhabditis angaria]
MLRKLTLLVILAYAVKSELLSTFCLPNEYRPGCPVEEIRTPCPFKDDTILRTVLNKTKIRRPDCERSEEFRKWLAKNPEQEFHRSDDTIPTFCCFEVACLVKCDIDIDDLVDKKFGPLFPQYLSYIYERFPFFFQYANATEVKEVEEGTASSQTTQKWTLYLGHLAYDWDRQMRRKERFARSKC